VLLEPALAHPKAVVQFLFVKFQQVVVIGAVELHVDAVFTQADDLTQGEVSLLQGCARVPSKIGLSGVPDKQEYGWTDSVSQAWEVLSQVCIPIIEGNRILPDVSSQVVGHKFIKRYPQWDVREPVPFQGVQLLNQPVQWYAVQVIRQRGASWKNVVIRQHGHAGD
jgi:hypothetical protein